MIDYEEYKKSQGARFIIENLPLVQKRLKQAYAFFEPFVRKEGALLDVGTRDGWFLEYLNEQSFLNVLGIDLTEEAVRYAQKQGRNVIVGDAHDLSNFEREKYETVLMIHSLEHCYDPKKAVDNVHRALKLGGIFFIEVPLERNTEKPAHFCNFANINDIINLLGGTRFQLLKEENYKLHPNRPDKRTRHLMCVFRKLI